MKCFYHADADGRCAGFWVFQSAGRSMKYSNFSDTMNEINYGMPFPFDKILPDEQIYIVDYSISPDEMRQLLTITKDVTWIDHHKTAIERYSDFEYPIRGIRLDGVAACMLTYCYLYHMTNFGEGDIRPFDPSMEEDCPYFCKLIADWDIWKFDYGDTTRYFQAAFNMYDFNPKGSEWWRFFTGHENEQTEDGGLVDQGIIISRYRDNWAKEYCKARGFEAWIDGYLVYALNLGLCNSEYFKSVQSEYDILAPFSFDGTQWIVSLYSKTVDVSKIAKNHGGGGHKGAAGFQCKNIFDVLNVVIANEPNS